jgi:hypothetical protein
MPVGVLTLAAALVAAPSPAIVGPVAPTPAVEVVAQASVPDSARKDVAASLATARSSYQSAWVQRQAGEYAAAIETAECGLGALEAAQSPDLDATSRARWSSSRRSSTNPQRREAPVEHPPTPKRQAHEDDANLSAPATEDIEPQFNADVYKWIEYFTGNGRSVFERWLRRSGQYLGLFRAV